MTETGGKIEEYTSNQAIIKSQKILNSTSNFHLKTEQENEDHKSPEQNRGEMREMWRKPRMPYSKLP